MGLLNLNTPRGLSSNCRRREKKKKKKKKRRRRTKTTAKHYLGLFADLEKRGIYFCE